MSVEGLFASLGLGELLTGDLFLTQMGVLGATAVLFLSSLALSVMSFRSASATQRALRSAEDLAAEMRHLTAQVEYSSRRHAPAQDHGDEHVCGEGCGHAEERLDLTDHDRAEYANAEASLEAAKKAAIEPSALLRGRLRRR